MKKTFAILLASTALSIGVGIPAWSAMHAAELFSSATDRDGLVQLAGDDGRGDSDHEKSARSRPDGDRHGDGDDDDGGEDDDDNGGSAIVNPAPAAAVAPPANGLFDSRAAPKVKVN